MTTAVAVSSPQERLAPSPLGLLRSSLFAAAEQGKGHLKRVELVTSKNFSATYSGPKLSQQHAIVWQAIVREHRLRNGTLDEHAPLRIRQSDLLRAVGRTDTSTPAREWLAGKLTDLQQALIELRTPKHHYSGQLIGEVIKTLDTGAYQIHIPTKLAVLLSDELAFIDLDRKLTLGRNQLACWLHDFISSQSNSAYFPQAVRDLHKMCGTSLALPQFRPRLRAAVELLRAGNDPLLLSAHINTADQLVFEKATTYVLLKRQAADAVVAARYKHEEMFDAALERRGRVAL